MTDRRNILKGMGLGGGAMLTPVAGLLAAEAPSPELLQSAAYLCGPGGRIPGEIPNVALRTHAGRLVRFRDDLVDGRVVMVNCMSIAHERVYPVAANLARVQRLIGERLSSEVSMLSLSVDPRNDTPQALNDFARQHGAGPSWTFLTGPPASIGAVRNTFYNMGNTPAAAGHDCALGLIRYGNAGVGLWGAVPAQLDAAQIVDRLTWVQRRDPPSGPSKRRGPNPRTFMT